MRRLFTVATAVSSLLCIASCAMWIRSGSYVDIFQRNSRSRITRIVSGDGLFLVTTLPVGADTPTVWRHVARPMLEYDLIVADTTGFQFSRLPLHVGVPYWFVALVFIVLPLLWLWRRFRRVEPGHCIICGYDLRATPDRCPECGTVSTSEAGTAR